MKYILLISTLFITNLYSTFNFGECQGSGSFEQQIVDYSGNYENTTTVGTIPQGIKGLRIELISDKDVDIRLYGENNDKIVHWPYGLHNQSTQKTKLYKNVNVKYSGFNGINGQKGHEFIEVMGAAPTNMTMKAFGYKSGYARINYSWIGKENCELNTSGTGDFEQTILNKATAFVGTIPPNINNLEINLTSETDIDIQLYAADGTAIVAWHPIGLISGATQQSIEYHGMTIEWSGYNGLNGKPGHEYIKLTGNTTEVLTMKVYGYEAGMADVTYSWGDVDSTPPVITLIGDNPQIIELGTSYTELGATTNDNSEVNIDSTAVDISEAGSYTVTYNAEDAANNQSLEVIRTVKVEDSTNAFISIKKVIYEYSDFYTNKSKNHIGEFLIKVNQDKGYMMYVNYAIGLSTSGIQPRQYFGYSMLDSNRKNISGNNGTYQYILRGDRVNPGEHTIQSLINDNPGIDEDTSYIRPVVLANYHANENAVDTNWTNIKIVEYEYINIERDILKNRPMYHVYSINNTIINGNQSIEGTYGTITINEDGKYIYRLDVSKINLFDSFYAIVEKFEIVISDDNDSKSEQIKITINDNGSSPYIRLNGNEYMELAQGFTYNEEGAEALDYEDGKINLMIESTVDSSTLGDYEVNYSAKDSHNNLATSEQKIVRIKPLVKDYMKVITESSKAIGASYLNISVSASLLTKHRINLGISDSDKMNLISNYSYNLIDKSIFWNQNIDGGFLWQPGLYKNHKDYKYAGKIDGVYQVVPSDVECSDPYSELEKCNLQEAVVEGIGMDSSHYLGKWLVYFYAMKEASHSQIEYAYYDEILKSNAIQIENNVSKFVGGIYRITNFMDGTNGVYRWNYSNRGKNWGYNSYNVSNIHLYSSLAFTNSPYVDTIYRHILNNIPSYSYINSGGIRELFLSLSLKYNNENSDLTEKEKNLFDDNVMPKLLLSFTNDSADSLASYYKLAGQHYLIMNYAFKHNILEWKKIYYQHFKQFCTEVIDTNARHYFNLEGNPNVKWKNLNSYYESHFSIWVASFLQLSSAYDGMDYSNYDEYSSTTELKLRNFFEKYVFSLYTKYSSRLNSFK